LKDEGLNDVGMKDEDENDDGEDVQSPG